MIRHLLLIRFKPDTSTSQIQQVRQAFEHIPNNIEGICSLEWGTNDSPEDKNNGFTHSVLMTFENETARQHYLPHPEHLKLKQIFRPVLDDIIVFDYQV